MNLTREDIRPIACQSIKLAGLGLVGTADSIETDRDRRVPGALFETEGFVESSTLISPSPYERYVQTVDRFRFLGDVKIVIKRLAGVDVTDPDGIDVPVCQTSSNANPRQRLSRRKEVKQWARR